MEKENTPLEKVNTWIKSSVTLKLITITILMLLLIIPASMIISIIEEREQLKKMAIAEVSTKWANSQQITGPILSIPLVYEFIQDDKKMTTIQYHHLLPTQLNIEGVVNPETLQRGIYPVVVYRSDLAINGNFQMDINIDQENLKEIRYDQAFITVGISDLRGIRDLIKFDWGGESLQVEPGSRIGDIKSGITLNLPDLSKMMNSDVAFSFDLNLKGSQNLSFVPVGGTTDVKVYSDWSSPSFNGNLLPESREVREEGFNAHWTVLQLNRNYPQSWSGSSQFQKMDDSAFGVDLILPLDDYQKSMRSAKYAVMTIALTFLIFFLAEIHNKRKIHPFQYILVGLALCLFYVLLVSISEHSNFNFAYWISTGCVVVMIAGYSISIFRKRTLTMVLTASLVGIYGFLFITLQLADYALLMGSIGLTLILAATMYFTRNINWYKLNIQAE